MERKTRNVAQRKAVAPKTAATSIVSECRPAAHVPRRNAAVESDPRWARIVARDRSGDGEFWYSVATTGVYCRPSCASRTANPLNVTLHATLASARATGCRPCKRCQPDGPDRAAQQAAVVTEICRRIAQQDEPLSLTALATMAGWSPSYFHRVFRAITGVTPKAYTDAHRAQRVRDQLASGGSITTAFHAAGFQSSGRFYEHASGLLGMTPRRYRAGAPREDLYFAVGQSSLGATLVAMSTKGVAAILLGDDPEALLDDLQRRFPRANLLGGDAAYEHLIAKVLALVEAPGIGLDLPLDIRGTAFQQRVWQALQQIPVGDTASYADIAARIGQPTAVRAVAGACASNAIAIVIPCHRVIRTDGALSGYAWGIDRKRTLIAREQAWAIDGERSKK